MEKKIRKIGGANMDIDFSPAKWKQGKCPWGKDHKCAVKNTSICDYFEGIEKYDNVLCSYPVKEKPQGS
jgi:hypothetical protein